MSGLPRPPKIPKFPPPEVVESPRIAALAAAVAAGEDDAVARFWAQAEAEGTPLCEPIAGAPRHRIVTFLWRGGDELAAVVVQANKLTDPSVLAASTLERVPGTDVWHRSYRLRADWRASYQLAPVPHDAVADRERVGPPSRWGAGEPLPDPLCPRTFPARYGQPPLSVAELSDAPPQPWLGRRRGAAAGAVGEHVVASRTLGNERSVWLYEPPGAPAGPLDVLVLLDGEDWATRLPAATILDNLIAAGRIPPMVAVMPDALDTATRWRELACHAPFVDFLAGELLPWVRERAPAARTDRALLAGRSLGALTALYAALRDPARFDRVLMQSASLWWPSGSEHEGDAGAIIRAARLAERLPARVYLEVGLQEWALLGQHRHLRDVLELRGVEVAYAEYHGGHDAVCWQGGLADGLLALAGQPAGDLLPA